MAEMKEPGPDHPITISPAPKQVRVRFENHVIAASDKAMVLKEANYPPVFYLPRSDVESAFLSKTTHTTHCPYKGDASYYSMFVNGDLAENVAWSYEHPYPAVEAIRDMLAFYPDRVEVYEIAEGEVDDHRRPAFAEKWPAPDSGAP